MREQIIQAIKDISEKEQDFTIETNVDVAEYAKKNRKFESRKYSARTYGNRALNISIKYNPTGIIEIYGGGGDQALSLPATTSCHTAASSAESILYLSFVVLSKEKFLLRKELKT